VTTFLILGDVVTLAAAFASAYWIRFFSDLIPVPKGIPPAGPYIMVFPLVALLYVFKTSRLYRKRERFSLFSEVGKVIQAVSLGFFILMALHFLYRGDVPFSRAFVILAWMTSILFLSFERGVSNQLELWLLRRKKLGRKVIIIGMAETSQRLIKGIENDPRLDYEVLGVVSDQPTEETIFLGKPVRPTEKP